MVLYYFPEARMLRISKLTDYATVILGHMSEHAERLLTAAEVAEQTRIGQPTVSKLLKELQRAGLVSSARGAHGGYQLARPAGDISAAAIIGAVEGPVGLTECAAHPGQCEIESTCGVGRSWQHVNLAIWRALHDVTLLQLTGRENAVVRFPDLAAGLRNGSLRVPGRA
jgi:FeS assembly SUF system regulator